MKAKPKDFANGVNVVVRMKGVKDDLQAFDLNNFGSGRIELPFTERRKAGVGFGG